MKTSPLLRQTDYPPPSGGAPNAANAQEAGSVDNRLSLDPSDEKWKGTIDAWQDGETYDLKVKVRQISPGEYEVVSASGEAAPEIEEEVVEEEIPMSGKSTNPAVAGLME